MCVDFFSDEFGFFPFAGFFALDLASFLALCALANNPPVGFVVSFKFRLWVFE
jgi:hypothetical protein